MAEHALAAAQAARVGRGRRFSKMHGAGNDFVVLDLRDGTPPPDPSRCRAIADRHTGVGCDQILTIEAPRSVGAVASYRIWNADGSPSQQCGNGARCVAAWLWRDGLHVHRDANSSAGAAADADFVIDSPAGTHAVTRTAAGSYCIAMGVPDFAPARIPLHGVAAESDVYLLDSGGGAVELGAVSLGNPHAVIEVDEVDTAPVAVLGPLLQASAWFPQSVNVGFAQVQARDRVRLRVYERGVGETLACGSGACAAAAVLMRRGRVDREVTVALPGGELQIAWPDDDASMSMAGPAAFVFEGMLALDKDEREQADMRHGDIGFDDSGNDDTEQSRQ